LPASERCVNGRLGHVNVAPHLSLKYNLVGSLTLKRRYSAFASGFDAITS
jgi:hypothetical protein